MSERNPSEYTREELQDIASHIDRRKYPQRAAAIDAALQACGGPVLPERPILDVRCSARIGQMYYINGVARLLVFSEHIEVKTFLRRESLRIDTITALELEREFLARWIQIRHRDREMETLAVRILFGTNKLLADLRAAIGEVPRVHPSPSGSSQR